MASLAGWAGGVSGLAGGGCGDGERTAADDDDDGSDDDRGGGDADVFGDGPVGGAILRAIISTVDCARVCADFMPLLFPARARLSPQIATSCAEPLEGLWTATSIRGHDRKETDT